ncbi:MAG: hypothetical protein Q6363_007900 [Candidatus Njordarchaeota archaeon]
MFCKKDVLEKSLDFAKKELKEKVYIIKEWLELINRQVEKIIEKTIKNRPWLIIGIEPHKRKITMALVSISDILDQMYSTILEIINNIKGEVEDEY